MKVILLLFVFLTGSVLCSAANHDRTKRYWLNSHRPATLDWTAQHFTCRVNCQTSGCLSIDFYNSDGRVVGHFRHTCSLFYTWEMINITRDDAGDFLIIQTNHCSKPKHVRLSGLSLPTQMVLKWSRKYILPLIVYEGPDVPEETTLTFVHQVVIGVTISLVMIFAVLCLQWRICKKQREREGQVIIALARSRITMPARTTRPPVFPRRGTTRPPVPFSPPANRDPGMMGEGEYLTIEEIANFPSARDNNTSPESTVPFHTKREADRGLHSQTLRTPLGATNYDSDLGKSRMDDENQYLDIMNSASVLHSMRNNEASNPTHLSDNSENRVTNRLHDQIPCATLETSITQSAYLDDTLKHICDPEGSTPHIYATVSEIQFSKDLRLHVYENTKKFQNLT